MSRILNFALAATTLTAFTAAASDATTDTLDGPLPYAVFESSVDHVDLADCPDDLDAEQYFCRMTLAAEQANVFVFSFDGDQPLAMVRHFPLEGDGLPY